MTPTTQQRLNQRQPHLQRLLGSLGQPFHWLARQFADLEVGFTGSHQGHRQMCQGIVHADAGADAEQVGMGGVAGAEMGVGGGGAWV